MAWLCPGTTCVVVQRTADKELNDKGTIREYIMCKMKFLKFTMLSLKKLTFIFFLPSLLIFPTLPFPSLSLGSIEKGEWPIFLNINLFTIYFFFMGQANRNCYLYHIKWQFYLVTVFDCCLSKTV